MREPAKTIVFGKNGFLGSYLSEHYQNNENVYFCSRSAGNKLEVHSKQKLVKEEIWDYRNIVELIHEFQPSNIINAIALTNANECEKRPQLALQANSEIPEILAKSVTQIGGRLIHISSDAVFGQPGAFFSEIDNPYPNSVYGFTKLGGEESVRRASPQHLIIRTNFFGYHKTKFTLFNYFYESFSKNRAALGFKDVLFNPVYVRDLVLGIDAFLRSELSGTIHFVGEEVLSKFDFGSTIAKKMMIDENSLLSGQLISGIEEMAHRKLNLTLSSEIRKSYYDCVYDVNSGILESIQRAKVNGYEL